MSRRRKVLVVATTFPRRDADDQPRFVLDLCKAVGDNFEQRVLAPSAPGCDIDAVVEGIPVRRFRYFFRRRESLAYGSGILGNLKEKPARWLLVPFFFCGLVLSLRKELRDFKPDIVHAHWWLPGGLAAAVAIATMRGGAKLLVTCHGADYFVLGERFNAVRRWVFDHADAVSMVSPAMRDHAVSRGFHEDKFTVAPMGVNLRDHFKPRDGTERRGVLYVGRLVEKKGVHDLLAAWAGTFDRARAHGLTIIGNGLMEDDLRALAKTLGVSDSVRFLGPVTHEELPGHYQRAALLVFPSIVSTDNDQEGLGLVAVEAMSCNCPVLASDIRSLTDVIVDAQTGFVFPMGDTTILARRLDELLSSPDLCKQVAERGGISVRSRFDWSVVGENYRSLYNRLLEVDD